MNVAQDQLNRWRAACHKAHQYALSAASHVNRREWREAREKADVAAEAVRVMGVELDQAGAVRPASMPAVRALPALLRDTPAARRYLEALRAARDAGEELDAERFGARADGPAAGGVELLIRDAEQEMAGALTASGRMAR